MKNKMLIQLMLVLSLSMPLADAQVFKMLYSFTWAPDGEFADNPVALAGNRLFSTTYFGGVNDDGAVYGVNTDGSCYSLLHSFDANSDGGDPEGGVVVSDEMLYGTTSGGNGNLANGTVFSMSADGSVFNTLHTFSPRAAYPVLTNSDGANPSSGLVLGGETLYGTAPNGGPQKRGTLFAINTNGGAFTVLHAFSTNSNDAGGPNSDLVLAGDTLYGTASAHGNQNHGVVFSVKTNGADFAILCALTNSSDTWGINGLALSSNILYGTTGGGNGYSNGIVFSVNTDGTGFNILHVFSSPSPNQNGTNWDGARPSAGLCVCSNLLYGTTEYGGLGKMGTLFSLKRDGSGFSALHHFSTNKWDGAHPRASVIISGNSLYGTTDSGSNGMQGVGTVFRFSLVPAVTDNTKPVLTIASPNAGGRVSNLVFSVTGTAKDNIGVANVVWELNGGAWTNATSFNNFSNWTAQAELAAGLNTFEACAVDSSGNFSPTSSVSFTYVLSAPLNVQINDRGSVVPNYANAQLEIGKPYTMTAKAAPGFAFAGWTGDIATNSPTIKFIMQSNLTLIVANFADVTKPILTITAPKSSQRVSNQLFTVTVTAKDNVVVTKVICQLNGGVWTAANPTASWSNWNASVNLLPGTNTLLAFAQDSSGNRSLTNLVKFVYVVSAPLAVTIKGAGTIVPNYNGAMLEVGKSYTMLAKPAGGWAFDHWGGSLLTNNPALRFLMTNGLTFTANFVDVTRPRNIITYPAVSQHLSNAVITATGKAGDNVGVSNVWCQLNGAGWFAAQIAANGTNWSAAQLAPAPGTNVIQAFAVDGAGLASLTNSVKFFYDITPDWAPLSLSNQMITVKSPSGNFSASFGAGTFAQMPVNTSGSPGVGYYHYLKTGTNQAAITVTLVAPPDSSNATTVVALTFTAANSAVYTNLFSVDSGKLTLAPISNLALDSLGGRTISASTGAGKITLNFSNGGGYTASDGSYGTYVYYQVTPVAAMLVNTLSNPGSLGEVEYIEVEFTASNTGKFFGSFYDSSGALRNKATGTFSVK